MFSRMPIATTLAKVSIPVALGLALAAFPSVGLVPLTAAVGLAATTPGCLVDGDASAAGIGVVTLGTIGTPCSESGGCSAGLFCYNAATPPASDLNGMCTSHCTIGAAVDPCTTHNPNAVCDSLVLVCALPCNGGETCPTGTSCNSVDGYCEIP